MRTLAHHVRNAECTATVTERVAARCPNTGRVHYPERCYTELSCGHSYKDAPVGTAIVCEWCQQDRAGLTTLEEALKAGLVSHTRCHTCTPDSISAYRYDHKSPSGFMAIRGAHVDDTPEANALIRRYSPCLSPLSPTERR